MARSFVGVRRIFFDLDDTLCGYWDASKAALRTAFELKGPSDRTPEEMVGHWAEAFRAFSPTIKSSEWYETYLKTGEPTRVEQMRLTLERAGIVDPAMASDLSAAYAEHRNDGLKLFPDAKTVLDRLLGRFTLGLITNGPADIQRQEIATLGIGSYFDRIYIEGEMGRGKPLADLFEDITAESGLMPEEILMVGNSYAHDIRPALTAGWRGVWIRRPSDVPPSAAGLDLRPEERPDGSPEPDAEIGELTQLLRLLGVE